VTSQQQRTEHLAVRPSWDCLVCSLPWPCVQAKEALLKEFEQFPSVLSIYMSSQMHDAFDDMTAHGGHAPPDLYERFCSWINHNRTD
jgi:hypothetical protein